jgi:hypothetical protein
MNATTISQSDCTDRNGNVIRPGDYVSGEKGIGLLTQCSFAKVAWVITVDYLEPNPNGLGYKTVRVVCDSKRVQFSHHSPAENPKQPDQHELIYYISN